MTADPTLARRVARLENDSESFYELIADVADAQRAHTRRFDRADDRLAGLADALVELNTTLLEVVRRLPDPS